ncbi:MAG: hypothetical protein MHM6MM_004530 [Cercozoa sp. M6MM]
MSGGKKRRKRRFDLWTFKTKECTLTHETEDEISACVYYHSEKERRRDPMIVRYGFMPCPIVNVDGKFLPGSYRDPSSCPLGDSCPHAHSYTENWWHALRWRIEMCQRDMCHQSKESGGRIMWFCSFAHSRAEQRTFKQALKEYKKITGFRAVRQPHLRYGAAAASAYRTEALRLLREGAQQTHSNKEFVEDSDDHRMTPPVATIANICMFAKLHRQNDHSLRQVPRRLLTTAPTVISKVGKQEEKSAEKIPSLAEFERTFYQLLRLHKGGLSLQRAQSLLEQKLKVAFDAEKLRCESFGEFASRCNFVTALELPVDAQGNAVTDKRRKQHIEKRAALLYDTATARNVRSMCIAAGLSVIDRTNQLRTLRVDDETVFARGEMTPVHVTDQLTGQMSDRVMDQSVDTTISRTVEKVIDQTVDRSDQQPGSFEQIDTRGRSVSTDHNVATETEDRTAVTRHRRNSVPEFIGSPRQAFASPCGIHLLRIKCARCFDAERAVTLSPCQHSVCRNCLPLESEAAITSGAMTTLCPVCHAPVNHISGSP